METLESRVVFSTGAMWSGLELGGFCTPAPAAVGAPVAEAEFSPANAVVSHIAVLAADPQTDNPYHNARLPADVDNDGVVTMRDGQALLAQLYQVLGSSDPPSFPPTPGMPDIPSADEAIYWDVSNDGFLSPLDLLIVVNELNRKTPEGEAPQPEQPPTSDAPVTPPYGPLPLDVPPWTPPSWTPQPTDLPLPSREDVDIHVRTDLGYTYVNTSSPLPRGNTIKDYGCVERRGDTFLVDMAVHNSRWDPWPLSFEQGAWTYSYPLGELAPGNYVFRLSMNGQPLRSQSFAIADTQPPQASLSVSDVTAPTKWHQFTVTYTDNHAVQIASLDDDDVVVTGPNSYREKATLVSVDTHADSSVCTVTYRMLAPAAGRDWSDNWNWPANGKYEVWLEGDQVWDTSQNAAEATHLGTFWVDVLEWTPYVPSGASVQIISGIQSTKALVELTFPNTAYRVADWGRAVRQGNSFVVAANVERHLTGAHLDVLTHASGDYDLGELEPGDYSFRFLVHGQLVQHVRFTRVDNQWPRTLPRNPIWMLPFGPALRWEVPARPRVESVWIADVNADSATPPVLPALENSGQRLFEILAQDVAKHRDSGEPLPEDALFRLWDQLWNLPL